MENSLSKSKRLNSLMTSDEKQRTKSENSLDKFFLSVINSLIILDEKFDYLYVNKDTTKIAGIKPDQLLGKNIWLAFPKLVGTIFEKNVKKAMAERKINRFEWVSAYGNIVIFTVIPSDEGLLISCEIPEKSEEILVSCEEKYRYIIKHAPTGICEINYNDLKFKNVNDSMIQTIGYSEQELLSMTILDILSPEEINRFKDRIKRNITRKTFGDAEYRVITKDSQVLWINFTMRLTYENGNLDAILLVWHDITGQKNKQTILEKQKKRLEELVEIRNKQLREQERLAAIGQTANMVGHDIRNPLQAIISSVYLIRKDMELLQDNQERKNVSEELEQIENQIIYIDKIVNDLQYYGKPLTPEAIETDLKDMIESLRNNSIPKNIKTLLEISDIPKTKLDPLLFKRSMDNLISNAIQAMPNGGTLTIKAYAKENQILLSVEDNGFGIAEENKHKIFTPLFTTKAKGQGLGLAVVKRLIEAQKGKITFESQQGKGTIFLITIPINQ